MRPRSWCCRPLPSCLATEPMSVVSKTGFEPATLSFVAICSNPIELLGDIMKTSFTASTTKFTCSCFHTFFLLLLNKWRRRWVLIPRYSHWQCDALPLSYVSIYGADEGSRYPTIGLEDRYTSFIRHLHSWCSLTDSNCRPQSCKDCLLPLK